MRRLCISMTMVWPAVLLSACVSAPQYERIGYGPELHVAQAECEIASMSVEQGVIAWGTPEYVAGAQIGNALANSIRVDQFMKNCMIIKGWGRVSTRKATATAYNATKPAVPHPGAKLKPNNQPKKWPKAPPKP